MTHKITLTLIGEPVGKARARTVRVKGKNGQRTMSFTPDKTVHAENLIREQFIRSGQQPFARETPIAMEVLAYFQRPKSAPKKRVYPISRPDWDNVGKLVADALNGLAFDDDSRIVDIRVTKRYVEYPAPERTEVTLWEALL